MRSGENVDAGLGDRLDDENAGHDPSLAPERDDQRCTWLATCRRVT